MMNNNMNNLESNPMDMNPMLMNNMGMNMQPNLMDNTAIHIKNIIKPYEDKIRQLEEIIKQKDFEIIVLKEKLNKSNLNNNLMNMNPTMDMNMNPMMNMGSSSDNKIKINIESRFKNFLCHCDKNDKPSGLKSKLFLTYNYEELPYGKTLEEIGISNGSSINITDSICNITFEASTGLKTFIKFDGYCPLIQAIKLYCEKLDEQNIYQYVLNKRITFLFNGFKLDVFSTKLLKEIFGNFVRISVFDSQSVIG